MDLGNACITSKSLALAAERNIRLFPASSCFVICSDGSPVQLSKEVACTIPYVAAAIQRYSTVGRTAAEPLELPRQVGNEILSIILGYVEFHVASGRSDKERNNFDDLLVRNLDRGHLCELTSAADALNLQPLVEVTSRALARLIEGRTPEEIRQLFSLPDDLTEDELLEPINVPNPDARTRLLNRWFARRRKKLMEEPGTGLAAAEQDTRSVEELMAFIQDDSKDEGKETGKKKKRKHKRRKGGNANDGDEADDNDDDDGPQKAPANIFAAPTPRAGPPRSTGSGLIASGDLLNFSIEDLFPEEEFEEDDDQEVDEFAKRLDADWRSCLQDVLADETEKQRGESKQALPCDAPESPSATQDRRASPGFEDSASAMKDSQRGRKQREAANESSSSAAEAPAAAAPPGGTESDAAQQESTTPESTERADAACGAADASAPRSPTASSAVPPQASASSGPSAAALLPRCQGTPSQAELDVCRAQQLQNMQQAGNHAASSPGTAASQSFGSTNHALRSETPGPSGTATANPSTSSPEIAEPPPQPPRHTQPAEASKPSKDEDIPDVDTFDLEPDDMTDSQAILLTNPLLLDDRVSAHSSRSPRAAAGPASRPVGSIGSSPDSSPGPSTRAHSSPNAACSQAAASKAAVSELTRQPVASPSSADSVSSGKLPPAVAMPGAASPRASAPGKPLPLSQRDVRAPNLVNSHELSPALSASGLCATMPRAPPLPEELCNMPLARMTPDHLAQALPALTCASGLLSMSYSIAGRFAPKDTSPAPGLLALVRKRYPTLKIPPPLEIAAANDTHQARVVLSYILKLSGLAPKNGDQKAAAAKSSTKARENPKKASKKSKGKKGLDEPLDMQSIIISIFQELIPSNAALAEVGGEAQAAAAVLRERARMLAAGQAPDTGLPDIPTLVAASNERRAGDTVPQPPFPTQRLPAAAADVPPLPTPAAAGTTPSAQPSHSDACSTAPTTSHPPVPHEPATASAPLPDPATQTDSRSQPLSPAAAFTASAADMCERHPAASPSAAAAAARDPDAHPDEQDASSAERAASTSQGAAAVREDGNAAAAQPAAPRLEDMPLSAPDAATLSMLDNLTRMHSGPPTIELLQSMLELRIRKEQLVHALAVRHDPVSRQIFSVMRQHNPALERMYPTQDALPGTSPPADPGTAEPVAAPGAEAAAASPDSGGPAPFRPEGIAYLEPPPWGGKREQWREWTSRVASDVAMRRLHDCRIVKDVLTEIITHLGLSDFLSVTLTADPVKAFNAGDKAIGMCRGRYADKAAEWPADRAWAVPLSALDCLQVIYAQRPARADGSLGGEDVAAIDVAAIVQGLSGNDRAHACDMQLDMASALQAQDARAANERIAAIEEHLSKDAPEGPGASPRAQSSECSLM